MKITKPRELRGASMNTRVEVIAALIALVALLTGILYGLHSPSLRLIQQNKVLQKIAEMNDFWKFITIYMNNLSVMLILYVSSIAIIPGLIILFSNGVVIGSVAAISSKRVGTTLTLLLLVPHGVFELYAFIYSAAIAIALPFTITKRKSGLRHVLEKQLQALLYASIILFIAAFIEAFITAKIASLVTG